MRIDQSFEEFQLGINRSMRSRGFDIFLVSDDRHKELIELCRSSVIDTKQYGKLLTMLWNGDIETQLLAYTIIKSYGTNNKRGT